MQRFIDSGIEEIVEQSMIDLLKNECYYIDNGLDEIISLLNQLYNENVKYKTMIELIKEKYNQNGYIDKNMLDFNKCDIEYPHKFVNKIYELNRIFDKNKKEWFDV